MIKVRSTEFGKAPLWPLHKDNKLTPNTSNTSRDANYGKGQARFDYILTTSRLSTGPLLH